MSESLSTGALIWLAATFGGVAHAQEAPADGEGDVVEIESSPLDTYDVDTSAVGTRTETPIFEVPAFISAVPWSVMDDQANETLRDALRNISGVSAETVGGFNGPNDTQMLRGFRLDSIYYNGFRLEGVPSINLPTLERVEYLKGPSSVLYGLMEPGGVLNLVSRTPSETPLYRLQSRYGSFHRARTAADLGGPVTEDGSLRYRLNAGYQSNESFRDHVSDRRYWLVPSLAWEPAKGTRVFVELNVSDQNRTIDEGVAFDQNRQPVADISTFLGERGLPGQRYDMLLLTARVEQDLGEHLTARVGFLMHDWANDMFGIRRSRPLATDMGTVQRLFEDSDFEQRTYNLIADVRGRFDLGPTQHEVLVGVDWRTFENTLAIRRGGTPEIDLQNPVYGAPDPEEISNTPLVFSRDWIAVFAQEQATLFDDLHVSLGGRFDSATRTNENQSDEPSTDDQDDSALTGKAGLLYVLPAFANHRVALFGDVSQSFQPTNPGAKDKDGASLDPETGLQYEGGLKLDLLGGAVNGTLAWFQLTKDNVSVPDPDNDGAVMNAGTLRSQGVEVDIAGSPVRGLSLIASYSFTDTEVVESTTLTEGNALRNIPQHAFSLWARWVQPTGALKGFGLGAGVFGVGERQGDDANDFQLDGYTRFDAAAYYRHKLAAGPHLRFQLNVQNLADTEYYESSLAATRVFPGVPRSVYGMVEAEF